MSDKLPQNLASRGDVSFKPSLISRKFNPQPFSIGHISILSIWILLRANESWDIVYMHSKGPDAFGNCGDTSSPFKVKLPPQLSWYVILKPLPYDLESARNL